MKNIEKDVLEYKVTTAKFCTQYYVTLNWIFLFTQNEMQTKCLTKWKWKNKTKIMHCK